MTEVDGLHGTGEGTRAERALRRWLEGDDSAIADWLDDGGTAAVAPDWSGSTQRPEGRLTRRRELAERLSHRIVTEVLRALAEIDPAVL
ncbi:MAG: hypothetical protein E6K16_02935 [Methanobacteriota archaeon]|nr:MAG: hypothetical protein E6K16_02935 [Euryarchaeota archaeon]